MSHVERMPFRLAGVIRRGILCEGSLKNGRNTAMMQNGMFEKVNNVTGDRRCGSLRESI